MKKNDFGSVVSEKLMNSYDCMRWDERKFEDAEGNALGARTVRVVKRCAPVRLSMQQGYSKFSGVVGM